MKLLKENSVDIGEAFLESCLKVSTRAISYSSLLETSLMEHAGLGRRHLEWRGRKETPPGVLIHSTIEVEARLTSFPGKDFLKMTQIF